MIPIERGRNKVIIPQCLQAHLPKLGQSRFVKTKKGELLKLTLAQGNRIATSTSWVFTSRDIRRVDALDRIEVRGQYLIVADGYNEFTVIR